VKDPIDLKAVSHERRRVSAAGTASSWLGASSSDPRDSSLRCINCSQIRIRRARVLISLAHRRAELHVAHLGETGARVKGSRGRIE